MKTIAQLLQLKKNPHYKFTPEEQEVLDTFLSTQSEHPGPTEDNLNRSSKKTPANVLNKNIVKKETGVLPTAEQIATGEELAEKPAKSNELE